MNDSVEEEYERLMNLHAGDPDYCYELSVGLRQYREMYKNRWPENYSSR